MRKILRFKPGKLNETTKLIAYFCLGTITPIILMQIAQAAGSSTGGNVVAANRGLAPYATIALVIGGVFLVLYVRAIYLVLTYAAKTYAIDIDFTPPSKYGESIANRMIAFGSALLVVGSALIISSYGWGPWFLFTGPTICLLCSSVILVSIEIDIRKYKETLKANHEQKKLVSVYDD